MNPADFFTKVLPGPAFQSYKKQLMQNHIKVQVDSNLVDNDKLIAGVCATACCIEV